MNNAGYRVEAAFVVAAVAVAAIEAMITTKKAMMLRSENRYAMVGASSGTAIILSDASVVGPALRAVMTEWNGNDSPIFKPHSCLYITYAALSDDEALVPTGDSRPLCARLLPRKPKNPTR
jgi:hypothetical protein